MNTRSASTLALWCSLLASTLLTTPSATAQTPFVRDDNYMFQGDHELLLGSTRGYWGPTADDFRIIFKSTQDFRRFNIRARGNRHYDGGWFIRYIKIDMDNDGTYEFNDYVEGVASYLFPEPANGISEVHSVKIELEWMDAQGRNYWHTVQYPVTILPQPRVYVDGDGNTFIQLHNRDCTTKLPVLIVEGIDPNNGTFPEAVYESARSLVDNDLDPNVYEVFILNWRHGGGAIQSNAAVLRKAAGRRAAMRTPIPCG